MGVTSGITTATGTPPRRKWGFLPTQLPRHSSHLYFYVRLITTLLILLTVCLHAGQLRWELYMKWTIYPKLYNLTGFCTGLALGFLFILFIINLVDLYKTNLRRSTLIGLDTTFGLCVLAMALNNSYFWPWLYKPYECRWCANKEPEAPMYKFGLFVLVCHWLVVVGSFWCWCITVFNHRMDQPNRIMPNLRPRHPSKRYFIIQSATTIILFLSVLMHISLAAWEGYFAPKHLDLRRWSFQPFLIPAILLQAAYLVVSLLDLYFREFPRVQLVGLQTGFWVLVMGLAIVNVVCWPVNYYPHDRQYCSKDGGYENGPVCPESHPARVIFDYGMFVLAFVLLVAVGGLYVLVCNVKALRREKKEERKMGNVELERV